jgi:amino acid adenylation domain-containing protein
MTAARAILQQMEQDGPELQERLNARTEALAERLTQLFAEKGVDFEVVRFASLFRIQTPPGHPLAELFFYHMRLKGMYVWDQRNHFVSPAHSDADLDRFVDAARESLGEMIDAGVLDADPTAESDLSISGDGMPGVPVASTKKELPLTDGQREIWTATQMEARANSVYNESIALKLTGAVSLDALESAAQFIVDRHEALRTTFVADGSAQIVHPSVQLPFDMVQAPPDELDARLQEQHAAPFDLENGPLVRCAVFQMEPSENPTSVLIWTAHHLVADGWSLDIILNELATAYTSLDTGTVPDLEPATPLDVLVEAQSEPMEAETKAFWTEQFAGFDNVLDLPLDAPRPAEKTYRGGEVVRTFTAADTSALANAAQSMGTTLFSSLLAGYGAFLGRMTGQDDLVVGIPSALQYGLDGGEALVGHGVNVLPMRMQIDASTPFSDWTKSVQSQVLDAREHGQATFGSLLNLLNVRRTGGRVPLVETILNLDADQDLPAFADLDVSSRNVPKAQTTFDLAFDMLIADGELSIYARYNADILSRETVDAWLESFEAWMKHVASNPSAPLAELSTVSNAQLRQLTEEWSRGRTDEPLPTAFLGEVLAQQAQSQPDAVALESRGTRWTYAELDAVVNAMGEALQSRGVAAGDRVALHAERTMHTIAAALAIMRIGGVYVPLDPSYPGERIAYILSDSGARVLAHATEVPEELAQRAAATVDLSGITVDMDASASPSDIERTLADPAYIIYTSGSTGTPKGVEVPHRGIANLATSQVRLLELQPADRILQMAALGFDASIFEISKSICAGATLVIGERGERVAIEAVSALLADTRTTVATLPPPLLGALNPADLPDLRAVVVAGEACPQDVADRWGDAVMLFNGYGPTEATVCATMGRLRPGQPVTIGRPIDHVHVYILDANGHPVPPSVFGELCIGGPSVALGYVGRPEETDARFVADPCAESGDARMYRTGDRCRWRLDGTIDFGGRIDDQLLIHGYRVEPGEIEGVLRAPEVVQDATVRLHQTDSGPVLAAYLVPDSDALDRHVESDLLRDEHNHQETFYAEAIREHTATDDANREALLPGSSGADAFVNPTTSLVDIYEQTIDVEESGEWMRQNLDRIRALSPDRMLEIGCGTSEVLFTIAPSCSRYDATDLSASAVAYTRSLVEQPGSGLGHVTVQQRPADTFDGWEKDAFDLVYFGSVVQYFPNAAYLRDVLTKAAHVTAPGGTIYLSDVNSHAFFDVLYTEGMLKKADGDDTAEEVRERIERRLRRRNWLFLEPAFFAGLQDAIPELGGVQIRLRRAATKNQPAKYHYDVFLTMRSGASASATPNAEPTWHVWETIRKDAGPDAANDIQSETDRLLSMLEEGPEMLAVGGVPNARVLPALRAFRALPDATGPVQPLKAALSEPAGVDPEAVWVAGEERGYTVDIAWSEDGGRDGTFDVVFRKNDADGQPSMEAPTFPVEMNTEVDRPLANDPAGDRDAMLIDLVRSRVNSLLPAYMRPSRYVVMDALPRTPNGKTDRKALPLLDAADAAPRDADYQAPRNATERTLVDVATEMLHVDRVGIHDDLFELGADSMLVFQICARVQTLGIPLRPQEFFQSKTIAGLAEGLARREEEAAREENARQDALREKIKNMSPEQVREMLARKKASRSPSGVQDS